MKILLILSLLLPSVIFANDYCQAYTAYQNKNFIQAQKISTDLAHKGSVKAQNLLGIMAIDAGKYSVAQRMFQNSGVKGNLKAAYNLGVYYFATGDNHKSNKWMLKAKDLSEAKLALGVLNINTNLQMAKEYLSLAAKEGNSFAGSHLCALLATDQRPSDNKYVSQCKGDVINDLYLVGKFYNSPKKYGSLNVAIYYLEPAAAQNNAKALNLLGELLYRRRGPSDEENALNYFKRASALGNLDAKVNAAWIYYTGTRWTRKFSLGFSELNEAYKKGSAKAKLYMGILKIRGFTFSGETVRQDINAGIKDIEAACALKDVEAMRYMLNNYPQISQNKGYRKLLQDHQKKLEEAGALHYLSDGC